ncbi:ParB family protein [Cupriavidus basilensis]|uniref:Protein with ParB-like nuclease domain in PFGI-1-like cluster n=1 Tax=Cupriavidus basilensis TaxID=68895 RepID=A0A0C4YH92_9BURK|nr:ParB family protein [Cupriavidus basilensis]AJG22353.1 Protein with ParB-like nuclease domain in PFGI-1-like cluster [Cupriavidus basilensis]
MSKAKAIPVPRSMSAVELAEKQGLKAVSKDDVRQRLKTMVHDSLQVPNPPAAVTGLSPYAMTDASTIDLPVMEIDFYDRNPRTTPNPEYENIKASIRAKGLENPLIVTRRPNTLRYMLGKGGNTRLRALQELWLETEDPRFGTVMCIYRTWKSESDVLASHLIENDVRGEMSFWDKATGILNLRDALQVDTGTTISLRDLESHLKRIGLPTNRTTLSQYIFATHTLTSLGPHLTSLSVRQIQPGFALQKRLASRFVGDENTFVPEVFVPAQQDLAAGLEAGTPVNVNQLLDLSAARLAPWLGVDPERVTTMLRLIEQFPEMTLGELQAHGRETAPASATEPSGPADVPILPDTSPPDWVDPLMPGEHAIDPEYGSDVPATRQTTGTPGDTAETMPPSPGSAVPPPSAMQTPGGIAVTPDQVYAKVRAAFMSRLNELARLAPIGHCFHEVEAAPYGFFIDLPKDKTFGGTADDPDRPLVWHFLVSLSGQLDPEIARRMPEGLIWPTLAGEALHARILADTSVVLGQMDPALLYRAGPLVRKALFLTIQAFHEFHPLTQHAKTGVTP